MDNILSMSCTSPSNACFKFQLIIDGCNGPIRFREHCLRKVETQETLEDSAAIGDEHPLSSSDASTEVNDDDATILSLLRPDSIVVTPQKNKSNKSKKNAKGKRKNNSKPKSSGNFETTESIQESPNRLDMIPLLQKLLISSSSSTGSNESELFDSIVVIFDGVSITKRPPVQVSKQSDNGDIEKETMDDEVTMGRSWNIASKSSNISTATKLRTPKSLSGMSGSLVIQITGLYDEADNVIVEHIQECRSQKLGRESPAAPMILSSESNGDTTRVQVMRRTERGAGKNRRLFQPLGLLRPESVACVFDFVASTSTNNGKDDHNENVAVEGQPRLHSSPFHKLAMDGEQTLRSVRRQNPGNVFVVIDDALEIPKDAGHTVDHTVVLPIVVTDDIFLRQRIIHEEGFVMTFHQLWLLLMDVN